MSLLRDNFDRTCEETKYMGMSDNAFSFCYMGITFLAFLKLNWYSFVMSTVMGSPGIQLNSMGP